MKSFNHKYSGAKPLHDFIIDLEIESLQLSDVLITVYSGVLEMDINQAILNQLKTELPEAKVIGCTTAGEIMANEVLGEQIVISFFLFEKTTVEIGFVSPASPSEMVAEFGTQLIEPNTKGLLLFPIVFKDNIDMDALVKKIYATYPELPILGGGAGDNSLFIDQYNFVGTQISNSGIAAATFNSDVLQIKTDHSFNWKPIGNTLKVTRSENRTIHEIDNRPALDVFEEYLGKEAANELPLSSLEFPLVFKEDNVLIGRIIAGVEEKSLVLTAPVKEEAVFQFSYGVREMAINHANSVADKASDSHVEAIMAFSCIARLNFLQSDAHKELVSFNLLAPVSGFFTYGEILHKPGENCYYLNETLTLAFFNENPQVNPLEITPVNKKSVVKVDDEERKLRVLTHLITKVTHELEDKNKELNNAYSILLDYNRIIDDKNFEIRKSLRYASSLQQIIMDNILDFSTAFEDYFLLFQPKDIVSGDFYFVRDLGDRVILAVADGTGHGVPGAFISILGMRLMEEIVDKMQSGKLDIDAAQFLNRMRDKMKLVFQRNSLNKYSSDGLDISIAIIDKEKQVLNFASANQMGLLYSNGEITQLKGDRMPIGVFVLEDDFTNQSFAYKKDDCLYLLTDGYADQFGGELNKKINQSRLRKIVTQESGNDLHKVHVTLDEFLIDWRGDEEQTDDILVMGVRF